MQPPSGGCVLKLSIAVLNCIEAFAAAFGRLCVETAQVHYVWHNVVAAAFGRLCVETQGDSVKVKRVGSSRLRAAVC